MKLATQLRTMPRLKLRVIALTMIGLIFALLVWYQCYYRKVYEEETRRLAIRNIFEVIGSGNTSASALVLPDDTTMILQPAQKFCEDDGQRIFMLFMVISSPENRERRDVIRAGWGSAINTQSERGNRYNKIIFFIGVSEDFKVQKSLVEEWEEHKDMVVEDMQDTYLNLTLKILRMFKWKLKHCPRSTYLVKIDDDVHINVHKFLAHMRGYSDFDAHNMIGGHMYNNSPTIRDPWSKWFVPKELWSAETFPSFVSGICYVLGDEAVPKIYKESLRLPLFHLEDVFLTGIIASYSLNMKLTSIPGMLTFWSPLSNLFTSSCQFQSFMCVHSVSSQMLKCWSGFNKEDFICGAWPLFTYC